MRVLRSDRLIIRALAPGDAQALAGMHADPAVMRHIGSGVRTPDRAREEALSLTDGRRPDALGLTPPLGLRAIEDGRSRAFCGWVALIRFDGTDAIELAYRLAQSHWGRGIATEAGAALLAHGFDELGIREVVAVTSLANRGSQRVIDKLGFEFVDRRRAYGFDDCLFYRLDAMRFSNASARLRPISGST